jgi:hypothetical protein
MNSLESALESLSPGPTVLEGFRHEIVSELS